MAYLKTHLHACWIVFALLANPSAASAANAAQMRSWRESLAFHASFDQGPNADFARGDGRIFTATDRNKRDQAAPGLPSPELVRLAPGEGRFGTAIEFRKKMIPLVFFRGPENLGYRPENWSGTVSFWMRLDPDTDLEPGYCDPFQIYAQSWTEGNLFVEFSKDHAPRHFRFGILPVTKSWNPLNRKYEEMPEAERPIVAVHRPDFRRDRWTHVLVTFANINSGAPDGRGALYLDGAKIGALSGWNHLFRWEPDKSVLTLGLYYVGFLDDFAIFDREFQSEEVQAIRLLPAGVSEILARRN